MSKKMKRVAFDSSSHESYEDVRARFKHQTLLQDYMELQQETKAARNNLMALKQKKMTLQVEVRFLRQRYKFLSNNKSSTPQEQVFVKPQPTQFRKNEKEKARFEKQTTLHKLPSAGKKKASRSIIPSPEFDLIHGNSVHGVKEQSVQRAIANQRVRVNGPKAYPFLDLGQKVDFFGSQEPVGQTRKSVIDLNQISREEEEEEEELQERSEPLDHHPMQQGLIRNGGSGKRKISWQDPVAFLRV